MIENNCIKEYVKMIETAGRLTNGFQKILEENVRDFKEYNFKLLHVLIILRIGDDNATVKFLQKIFFTNDISKLSLTTLLQNGFIKLEKTWLS